MAKKMELVSPKVERSEELRDYGKFTISPLERGFGVTLGNALRRVLLSSLEGAAITSVHVADVMHEFSTIPGVREDVIQVMLNIKELRFKLHNVESAVIHLEVRGQGTITGADIECPPEVEIINPESYLFSISEDDAHVEMEMTVKSGRGYIPATDRSDRLAIGELPVDAIFSPVRRVNWEVTSARVGHSTDYDRLILDIWTDGTISPEKALIDSSRILMNQLGIISGTSEETLTKPVEEVEEEKPVVNRDVVEAPIETLELGVRVFNSLKRTGITTIGDVLELLDKGESAMLSIRNFGEKSLSELKAKMIEKGYLKEEEVENE
ncbi:MAG: DNA-directed RNA polymerase subunit alpha [Anaerolineaceae bacterium]|mgnify:CR=1 FL=1|nr:DNA-directed RNA polymerase subunit alpha [Anaerolineaceae bacterium]MDD4043735.1 DNA-directed RNA polymerase subunit alpha [Anaerolineaceae bacterium]